MSSTSGYWRERAEQHIDALLKECWEQGLQGEAIVQYVDSHYPFGPRDYHPYQVWLRVRREKLAGLPGIKPLEPSPKDLDRLAKWNAEQQKLAAWNAAAKDGTR